MTARRTTGLAVAAIAAATAFGGAWAVQLTGHPWLGPILGGLVAGAAAGALVRPVPAAEAVRAAPLPTPPEPVQDAEAAPSGRLAELETQTASLRHDLRGILAPAMLVGDRLSENADPKVAKAGETVIRAVNRAAERLAQTKASPPPG